MVWVNIVHTCPNCGNRFIDPPGQPSLPDWPDRPDRPPIDPPPIDPPPIDPPPVDGSLAIATVAGALAHNGTITITGAGFGTKATAAPVIYDDASGASPKATGWSECSPRECGPDYDTGYRTLPVPDGTLRELPHGHSARVICGAHLGSGAWGGQSVHLEQYRTLAGRPAYTFASAYIRFDHGWQFDNAGENFKMFDWGVEHGGYDLPDNWYAEYGSGGNTWQSDNMDRDGSTWWHFNSDSENPMAPAPFQNPDANGHDWNDWKDAKSPFTQWIKLEYAVRWSEGPDGFVKIWEDGTLVVDYHGSTDTARGDWAANTRYDMIGGYSSSRGARNWRYFADVYLDYSLARVVLGNAPTLSACTIKEMQVPSAWANDTVAATVKLGALGAGPAYLFVVNGNGDATAGFPVTVV